MECPSRLRPSLDLLKLLIGVCLFSPVAALADDWIPYTDGRVGGCFSGHETLYGCTPQPNPISGQITGDTLERRENRELSEQNKKLQQDRDNQAEQARQQEQRADAAESELQQSRVQKSQDEIAARAAADRQDEENRQAWLQSPDGQAFLKEQQEQRKSELTQQQQIHDTFQRDSDLKTCGKRQGTINCSDNGCFCENAKNPR
jgi:hypothetical protein